MFDNIIGQTETVALLASQLASGAFPRAVLFHGPAYAAKLSTALEAARGLCCLRGSAEWTCPCASCQRHRVLTHPDLLLLGQRYFDVEMAASAEVLRRTGARAARYLFVRAVRKLLRRFDPALWDADSAEGRKVLTQAAAVEDLLEQLPEENAGPQALQKSAEAVMEAATRLLENTRATGIPIQQIRRLAQWAHLAPGLSRKVAIIEGADAINESARNALLKLLEEPPEGVTLILTTTRRSALIPTILSRLRPYPFVERTQAEQAEVLRRVFREEPAEYPRLRDYFLAWRALNPAVLRSLAGRFVALLAQGDGGAGSLQELIGELVQGGGTAEAFCVFCEELLGELQRRIADSRPGLLVLEKWNALVREAADYARQYNPGASLQLESLYYRMRAVA